MKKTDLGKLEGSGTQWAKGGEKCLKDRGKDQTGVGFLAAHDSWEKGEKEELKGGKFVKRGAGSRRMAKPIFTRTDSRAQSLH